MSLTLLAVGGPRHGQQLPYTEGQMMLMVPIMPDIRAQVIYPYCVHGGEVRSKTDGQFHWVPAQRVADLYQLRRFEYRLAGKYEHEFGALRDRTDRCLYPDPTGRYERWYDDDLTIKAAEYRTRAVSDRLCWVFYG